MNGDEPLILESGLYSRAQVLERLGISKETLSRWMGEGLRVCCRGSRQYYVYGADLIAFLRGGNPEPKKRRKGVTARNGN